MMATRIDVKPVKVAEINALRDLYRQEMNCQIVHDSYHRRGFTTPHMISVNGKTAGYGTVTNGSHHAVPAGTLTETYLLPSHRDLAVPIFQELLAVGQVHRIEAQTNDAFQLLMLYDFATEITSDVILFRDSFTTHLSLPDTVLRRATGADADPPVVATGFSSWQGASLDPAAS